MEKLYEKCKEVVTKSTSCDDEEIIDYFTIAFMALYSLKGHLILDKLPSIIEKLEIVRNDMKKVNLEIKIVCENGEAIATNVLSFPEDTENMSYYEIIESVIYFFTNLLRIKEIKNNGQSVEIKTGISSKRMCLDGTVSTGRGDFIEKGITNITVKDAIISLRDYLSEEYDDDISHDHYAELVKNRLFIYDIRIHLLNELLEDSRFKELIDDSFEEVDERKFSKAYNDIMDNDAAYARLIKLFKDLSTALFDNDEARIKSIVEMFYEEINSFKKKNKQYKKSEN